jgi:hypothetical protein
MRDAAATEMIMAKQPKLDTFTRSYIETALWSTHDESDEGGGEHLDENYGVSDFAPETLERVMRDTEQFQRENAEALEVIDSAGAGHDFWLTRNGHGAGFWDGDWPEPQATLLTKASKRMGEVDLYVGDDGQLYMTPGRREAEGHARRLDKDAFEGLGSRGRGRSHEGSDLKMIPGMPFDWRAISKKEAVWVASSGREYHVEYATGAGGGWWIVLFEPNASTGDRLKVSDIPPRLHRKMPGNLVGRDYAMFVHPFDAADAAAEYEQVRLEGRSGEGLSGTSGRFRVGERVQLHPGTDRWMMGDRYGEVVKVTREYVHVKLDKSGKTMKFSENNLTALDGLDGLGELSGADWALVRSFGLDENVVSTHRTKEAAEKAMRKHGGEPDSLFTRGMRVVNIGPEGRNEMIEIFGKRTIRPRR